MIAQNGCILFLELFILQFACFHNIDKVSYLNVICKYNDRSVECWKKQHMNDTVLTHDKRDITFLGKTKFSTIDFTSVMN